jgi:hypothetical protein
MIRGDTANGPCQARADRMAAHVAKASGGEVLMALGPGGISFGAASSCPEIMRGGQAGLAALPDGEARRWNYVASCSPLS